MPAGLPIQVLPRTEAEAYRPSANELCISITNPRQAPAQLEGWKAVLRLGFHDCEHHMGMFKEISPAMAKSILEFAKEHGLNASWTVHCEFGASRSVAVGLFLATWTGRPLTLSGEVLTPNLLVLRRLRIAALIKSIQWLDWRLARAALLGPLKLRHSVLPSHIANSYPE